MNSKTTLPVQIINVGQGDCALITPPHGCKFKEDDIFIDLGNGATNVFEHSSYSKNKVIIISHAHKDHMGGLSRLFEKNTKIKEILVPLWFDEIILITNFILKMKNVQKLPPDIPEVNGLSNVITSGRMLGSLSKLLGIPVRGCSEGMDLCDHIKLFNPPIDLESIYKVEQDDIARYGERMSRTSYEIFRSCFDERTFSEMGGTILTEGRSRDVDRIVHSEDISFSQRRDFITAFLMKYENEILKFNENPNRNTFAKVNDKLRKTSNDCSIVMKVNFENCSALFPGDVTIPVLEDIINKVVDISANILKVPHHGSKHCLNQEILDAIEPEIAIVSHQNGKFGRSRDPHPNKEVIKLLLNNRINTLFTNDVIKKEFTIGKKQYFTENSYVELIEG